MLGQCISSFFPASPEPISRSVRQNRFKSVAGLVGSLGTKQNDKSGIFRLTENLKVSDYMMFLLIPYVRKNEMIDLDVEIYQHLNEQIK